MTTMAVDSQVDANAKNRKLCAKASTGGGDGKFIAASAHHGCYCLLNNCHRHQRGCICFEFVRKAGVARFQSIEVLGLAGWTP
jgi:hypothetical protein